MLLQEVCDQKYTQHAPVEICTELIYIAASLQRLCAASVQLMFELHFYRACYNLAL